MLRLSSSSLQRRSRSSNLRRQFLLVEGGAAAAGQSATTSSRACSSVSGCDIGKRRSRQLRSSGGLLPDAAGAHSLHLVQQQRRCAGHHAAWPARRGESLSSFCRRRQEQRLVGTTTSFQVTGLHRQEEHQRRVGSSVSTGGSIRWKHSAVTDQNRSKSALASSIAAAAPAVAVDTSADYEDHDAGGEAPEQHAEDSGEEQQFFSPKDSVEVRRLQKSRNVGIFAHVDAGKTTVTERMLALAGVVRRAGSVDDGNTVTDFLPQERERGITIQSAAISFEWAWHNNKYGGAEENPDVNNNNVTISLIDTPGHIDFSVEVNRSVAVLDGAVLVVDAVAGVQAQTETVWRAMTTNAHHAAHRTQNNLHGHHEPLPCLALINKMDKEGCSFWNAVKSLREKLPGANPAPIQIPLFRSSSKKSSSSPSTGSSLLFTGENGNVVAIAEDDPSINDVAHFAGLVDLVHMRAIVWPDLHETKGVVSNVEDCVPDIIPLLRPTDTGDAGNGDPYDENCPVTRKALRARYELIESLAEVDETIEAYYLNEQEPSAEELTAGLRRVTISQTLLPVMMSAALRGKGVEPVLDAIADLLPSPLDRTPPAINKFSSSDRGGSSTNTLLADSGSRPSGAAALGHPLNSSLLALAFKVVHMKGRGGSGDGRVVFARVYSGELRERDTVQVVSPPAPGETALPEKPRTERVGGMLELAGGRFGNLPEGVCKSGGVCALVGLKSVVTGDTLVIPASDGDRSKRGKNKRSGNGRKDVVCLAGVSSPKPVLTVRIEAETTEQQARLSEALALLSIEDPSLVVEESEAATLLSGLGELHIEVTLDRLNREFGLQVMVGPPSVTYRETVTNTIETDGMVEYDRSIGGNRLQGAVHLVLEPTWGHDDSHDDDDDCMVLTEPTVTIGEQAREFLGVGRDDAVEDLAVRSEVVRALVQGCQGALKRGPLGPHAMANVRCHVVNVDCEVGPAAFQTLPGALRAVAANAVAKLLGDNRDSCCVLEPTMNVEVSAPNDMVGSILSDLTSRRGTVGDVIVGDDGVGGGTTHTTALINGDVPLVEILGYANSLRSLTGGEGAFTAEYKGHSPCS